MSFNPFGVTLTLMGLGFVVVPLVLLARISVRWYRTRTWLPWEAHVEELEVRTREGGAEGESIVHAHYRYRDADGVEHRGSGPLARKRVDLDAPDGRVLDVLVHPRDPRRSMVHTRVGRRLTRRAMVLLPVVLAGVLTLVYGLGSL